MQLTQICVALIALLATRVIASPAPVLVAGGVKVRGFICDFIPQPAANDACSTECKQEGNGKGGRCVGELLSPP